MTFIYNTWVMTALFLVNSIFANAFAAGGNNNIAVYWGQNSNGQQESLGSYCQNTDADIFILSFLSQYPKMELNFANACEGTYTSSGLLSCPQIASDIQTCQSMGKKVLLSLGGASGSYGFSSDSDATQFALTLWETFGPGSGDRPFGSAVVDGFDFDIENNSPTGYAALAKELRTLFAKDSSKQYYLSAAPQCPYPDSSVGDALAHAGFDFAFIQFYNNYCSLTGNQFNWDTWKDYASNTSPNKDIKLFVGLPGSSSAAGSGYADPSVVKKSLTSEILNDPRFGGISLWDAASANSNNVDGKTFLQTMKDIVNGGLSEGTSSSSTSAAPSSSSTPITSASSSSSSSSSSSNTDVATPSSSTVATTSTGEAPVATSSTVPTTTSSSLAGLATTLDEAPAPTSSANPAQNTPSTLVTKYYTAKPSTNYKVVYVTSTSQVIVNLYGAPPALARFLRRFV